MFVLARRVRCLSEMRKVGVASFCESRKYVKEKTGFGILWFRTSRIPVSFGALSYPLRI